MQRTEWLRGECARRMSYIIAASARNQANVCLAIDEDAWYGQKADGVNFEFSEKTKELQQRLQAFMDEHIYPNERRFAEEVERERWKPTRVIEELKPKARAAGLWNLFLPNDESGAGLTNLEYAPLCEIMGRSVMAPEVFNCSAPDTGNMEVLARYGTTEQKVKWLKPLLEEKFGLALR